MNRRMMCISIAAIVSGCTSDSTSDSRVDNEVYRPNETEREVREFRLRDQMLTYEVVEGVAVLDGDMVMGDVEAFESSLAAAGSWQGLSKNSGVWSMPVRFKFHSEVPGTVKTAVYAAISELESETSSTLTFTECGSSTTPGCGAHSRIKFRHQGAGCNSPVGRKTFPVVNTINLDTGCDSNTVTAKGSIRHEILHSLGFGHEHNRCDRDGSVTVNLANVQPGQEHNFTKRCGNNWSDVIGYNFNSIMHYSGTAWGVGGATTITTNNFVLQNVIGYRGPISAGDLSMIELKYGSPTLSNGSSCSANIECTSGNCVTTGWWVGAGSKCSAAACALGDWDAQNWDDNTCDNGCLLHSTELCPSDMDCVNGGAGSGVCVNSCNNDNDCPGDHPYCVYADGVKFAKLCNKANCSPCQYDSNPDNLSCDGTFSDGNSGDCGGGSTCFAGECVSDCNVDGDCGAGETCEYASSSRTTKYCNTANCTSCQYDTYPADNVCSHDFAAGTFCGADQECNGSGQCECTLHSNAHSCNIDSDCCSYNCEAMNSSGTLRQCNRIACPGEYDIDPFNLNCDNGQF